jgi:hypothetical protein
MMKEIEEERKVEEVFQSLDLAREFVRAVECSTMRRKGAI